MTIMPRVVARIAVLVSLGAFLGGCGPSSDNNVLAGGSVSGAATGAQVAPEDRKLAQKVEASLGASTTGTPAYLIGAQDVLEIVVFKVPDLTRSVQVADSGAINLPLIGEFPAAGKTAQQLERDLTARLGATYLNRPQVNIYVKEFNSQRVTVEGAVKTPGLYPIRGNTTLMQVIATAQGSDRDYASSDIMVLRNKGGQRVSLQIDLDDIKSGKIQDPLVQNGDIVVVPTSTSKSFFQSFLKMSPVLSAFRPTVW